MNFFENNNFFLEINLNKQKKIKVLIFLWRFAQYRQRNKIYSVIFFPIHTIYWFYSQILLGIELPMAVACKGPLIIWHGNGLVVNPGVEIGSNVVLRNGVTIGNNGNDQGCPVIGDDVEIGANSVLIGKIEISNNAKIGPNSFVNFDVKEGEKIISGTIKK